MERAKKLITQNPLISGSFVMLLGSNIANVIAYVYHPVLGRMLGKDAYGELAAFLALLGFLSSIYSFLGLVIIKYAAKHKTEEESVNHFFALLSFFNKPVLLVAIILFLLSPFLSPRLQIDLFTFSLISPIFYLSFLVFFYKAYLQGRLAFGRISLFSIWEVLGRFLLGLLMIFLGLGVTGAALGFLIAVSVEYFFLRRSIKKEERNNYKIPLRQFMKDGLPVLATTLSMTAFFSMDILLVRTFFASGDAGSYAAAAVLGKIILFATAPITAVLFPLISQKHSDGESGTQMFLLSFVITFLFGGLFALIFYFLPNLAVLPFGSGYLSSVPLLFPYGIFIFLFVLSLVIVNYYLPRERYLPVKALALGAVAQSIGILLFHRTLFDVVHVSIVVSLALLATLLVYFAHEDKRFQKILSNAIRRYPRL